MRPNCGQPIIPAYRSNSPSASCRCLTFYLNKGIILQLILLGMRTPDSQDPDTPLPETERTEPSAIDRWEEQSWRSARGAEYTAIDSGPGHDLARSLGNHYRDLAHRFGAVAREGAPEDRDSAQTSYEEVSEVSRRYLAAAEADEIPDDLQEEMEQYCTDLNEVLDGLEEGRSEHWDRPDNPRREEMRKSLMELVGMRDVKRNTAPESRSSEIPEDEKWTRMAVTHSADRIKHDLMLRIPLDRLDLQAGDPRWKTLADGLGEIQRDLRKDSRLPDERNPQYAKRLKELLGSMAPDQDSRDAIDKELGSGSRGHR